MMAANKTPLIGRLEMVWWLMTAVVAALILYPVYTYPINYPFLVFNIVCIFTFITLTRYIFLLPYTFLHRNQLLKALLLVVVVPLIFYLVQGINYFQTFIDENGYELIVGLLPTEDQTGMMNYLRSQLLLFGVGSVIAAVVFPIRLIISIWIQYNRPPTV